MGADSTLEISRERALELWNSMFPIPSDEHLEFFMDFMLEGTLYNARITGEPSSHDWGIPHKFYERRDDLKGVLANRLPPVEVLREIKRHVRN